MTIVIFVPLIPAQLAGKVRRYRRPWARNCPMALRAQDSIWRGYILGIVSCQKYEDVLRVALSGCAWWQQVTIAIAVVAPHRPHPFWPFRGVDQDQAVTWHSAHRDSQVFGAIRSRTSRPLFCECPGSVFYLCSHDKGKNPSFVDTPVGTIAHRDSLVFEGRITRLFAASDDGITRSGAGRLDHDPGWGIERGNRRSANVAFAVPQDRPPHRRRVILQAMQPSV
jgi:hypothetical protein